MARATSSQAVDSQLLARKIPPPPKSRKPSCAPAEGEQSAPAAAPASKNGAHAAKKAKTAPTGKEAETESIATSAAPPSPPRSNAGNVGQETPRPPDKRTDFAAALESLSSSSADLISRLSSYSGLLSLVKGTAPDVDTLAAENKQLKAQCAALESELEKTRSKLAKSRSDLAKTTRRAVQAEGKVAEWNKHALTLMNDVASVPSRRAGSDGVRRTRLGKRKATSDDDGDDEEGEAGSEGEDGSDSQGDEEGDADEGA